MAHTELENEFWEYVEIGRNLPKQAPDVMLIAYGYFKQASEGDNIHERPTENSDVVRTFMYDQWKRLEGMPAQEAMSKYITYIKELVIKVEATEKASK